MEAEHCGAPARATPKRAGEACSRSAAWNAPRRRCATRAARGCSRTCAATSRSRCARCAAVRLRDRRDPHARHRHRRHDGGVQRRRRRAAAAAAVPGAGPTRPPLSTSTRDARSTAASSRRCTISRTATRVASFSTPRGAHHLRRRRAPTSATGRAAARRIRVLHVSPDYFDVVARPAGARPAVRSARRDGRTRHRVVSHSLWMERVPRRRVRHRPPADDERRAVHGRGRDAGRIHRSDRRRGRRVGSDRHGPGRDASERGQPLLSR